MGQDNRYNHHDLNAIRGRLETSQVKMQCEKAVAQENPYLGVASPLRKQKVEQCVVDTLNQKNSGWHR